MPLYIDSEGVVKQITFERPVQVAPHEIEAPWWEKAISLVYRMFMGYK
jgi:hypothetical protein